MEKTKKITIGFLTSGVTDSFGMAMCKGASVAARKYGVNLVVFPGKFINRNLDECREWRYEYQNNTIFSYARKANLDAMIVAADSIGMMTTKANIIRFLSEYKEIPMILLASDIPGYISVNYDNESGIREGLNHIIEQLGCRKIGMIGASEDISDVYARKLVFQKVLEEHGIAFEDFMYTRGNLIKTNNPACKQLLDQYPDVEAVFCVNDESALALYDEMEKRGLLPGRDIKVFGYDDTVYAARIKPSLSSVSADPEKLAFRALEMALSLCRNEAVENENMKTRFIKRNSVRTVDREIHKDYDRYLTAEYIDDFFDHIFYRYLNERMSNDIQKLYTRFYDMVMAILEAYQVLNDGLPCDYIQLADVVDGLMNSEVFQYADVDMFVNYLDNLFAAMCETGTAESVQLECNRIHRIILRKMIYAMEANKNDLVDEKMKSRSDMKLFVRDMLQFERGNDQSFTVLLNNLDWVNIKNAYIYTFEEPMIHLYKEHFQLPDYMLLKAALTDGEVSSVPAAKQRVHVDDIFTHAWMPEYRYTMVTIPLYSEENLYGMMLCDLDDALYMDFEFLTDHLSSAMKMIHILRANEEIQQQLEESMAKLKEHNIALDSISKLDMLTGIFNRRGFYERAEQVLERNYENKKATLVCYIDMNNLKIINDRYGHEEGDFSLRLIGSILKGKAREESVIGRIGGDEFALVGTYDLESDIDLDFIIRDFDNAFHEFNFVSDKPYNISVCTGGYVVAADNPMTLEQALAKADERLYVAKQSRVKTVAKKVIRQMDGE